MRPQTAYVSAYVDQLLIYEAQVQVQWWMPINLAMRGLTEGARVAAKAVNAKRLTINVTITDTVEV